MRKKRTAHLSFPTQLDYTQVITTKHEWTFAMHTLLRLLAATTLMIAFPLASAFGQSQDKNPSCCGNMGGVSYCDSSAGRVVCGNGEYSACYCTRHAVMDLQKISGCCLWQGGVLQIDPFGLVICRDGSTSSVCSLQNPVVHVTTSW